MIVHGIPFLTTQATKIGVTCLVAQIIFTIALHKRTNILPRGPWNELPAFTAHLLVSFPLMIILTYYGIKDWCFTLSTASTTTITSHERVFGQHHPISNIPLAIGTGAILLWDIPTVLLSPPLRDPLVWMHHFGMATVALIMSGQLSSSSSVSTQSIILNNSDAAIMIGAYYAPYYFGVIEFSSIFLVYVDVFQPKHRYYDEWLHDPVRETKFGIKLLKKLNVVCRAIFAVLFLLLRGLYFPYVSFRYAIPDIWSAYNYSSWMQTKLVSPPVGVPLWTGYFLIGMIGLFACLQAYWGVLVARYVRKEVLKMQKKKKIA